MNLKQSSGHSVIETITDEATIYYIPPSLLDRRSCTRPQRSGGTTERVDLRSTGGAGELSSFSDGALVVESVLVDE